MSDTYIVNDIKAELRTAGEESWLCPFRKRMDGFKYFFVLPLQSLVDYIYICNGKEIDILKKPM